MSDIITRAEYDRCTGDYDLFVTILERVKAQAVEEALRILPNVMKSLTIQAAGMYELKNKFYTDHPELVPHRQLVATIVEQTEANNPGLSYEDIIKKALPSIEAKVKTKKVVATDVGGKPSLSQIDHLAGML